VDAGATKPEDAIDAARVVGSSYGSVVTITGPSDAIVEPCADGRVCFIQDGDGGPTDKGKVRRWNKWFPNFIFNFESEAHYMQGLGDERLTFCISRRGCCRCRRRCSP
jgi:hypothetical protein